MRIKCQIAHLSADQMAKLFRSMNGTGFRRVVPKVLFGRDSEFESVPGDSNATLANARIVASECGTTALEAY